MHSLPNDLSNTLQHQDLHLQQPLLDHALNIVVLQYYSITYIAFNERNVEAHAKPWHLQGKCSR